MTDATPRPRVGDLVAALDERFPRAWAEPWDAVGPVLGLPDAPVERVLCVVDCVPETVDEALDLGATFVLAHHPLLLRGVTSLDPGTAKGRLVHRLIGAGVALYTAHTNADVADPGVSDALAARFGLRDVRPLVPATGAAAGAGRGIGRVGTLPAPLTVAELAGRAAAVLPPTPVRAGGDPDRPVRTLAVAGGAGDGFLAAAGAAGADAYLCADLRHHPASEHLAGGGPALLDVSHWASERPWLDDVAGWLRAAFPAVAVTVSDTDTAPWTVHVPPPQKESRP